MVVVGLVGVVIVADPGFPACADQVPAPVAAMVAVVLANGAQGAITFGPALALVDPVMVTVAVDEQLKLSITVTVYVPALRPVIVEGLDCV